MIKKTKNKFVAIAMISVVLVMAVLMTVLNVMNYAQVDQEAEELLSFLMEHGGRFPDETVNTPRFVHSGEPSGGGASGEMEASGEMDASGEMGGGPSGGRKELRRGFTQETPYETRYFSVTLAEDGTVLESHTTQIAAVTAPQAEAMAQGLLAAGQTEGYYVNYKYASQPLEDGLQYVFLDCTTDRTAAEDFLRTSVLVSLCGIVVFFLLVLILSGWVIKPMAVSYDKQKEFITNAGHELKTPLTVIGSCTDVLELEQGENKWITGIREQVGRLGVLTQELVALARMDEGRTLEKKEFDLSGAVLEELEQFRVSAEHRGLELSLDIQPCILYRGNQASLRQLTAILGDNAIKYTSPAGKISFRLMKKGRKIFLVGTNPAEGVEKGDQSRLLERFYRGDTSHSSETSGYGIGLSMAASIAAAHGGKIDVRSEDGKNLTITVQL